MKLALRAYEEHFEDNNEPIREFEKSFLEFTTLAEMSTSKFRLRKHFKAIAAGPIFRRSFKYSAAVCRRTGKRNGL